MRLPAATGKRCRILGNPFFRHAALPRARSVATAVAEIEASATERAQALEHDLSALPNAKKRLQRLVQLGRSITRLPEEQRTVENRVAGCTAQVWMAVTLNTDGTVSIAADSDSDVTRGLIYLLIETFNGLTPSEIDSTDVALLEQLKLGPLFTSPARTNSFRNMFQSLKKRANSLVGELPKFPSLLITGDTLVPQGTFAEAQAQYLQPDPETVSRLASVLEEKKIGIVAHFYMDPEVQGVLSSAAEAWPHIHISDSLVMADRAVAMAEAGCKAVCVLGVDFMSENVRAILDSAGHSSVGVYRMDPSAIGCTLAEAAESDAYLQWLQGAREEAQKNVHVVYINTSLRTKALSHSIVPTITCTSSNVVRTVLQAFAQVPDVNVWYGPDTYMGRNLQDLLASLAKLPDEEVAKVHPSHSAESISQCLPRLHAFPEGACSVHSIFGGETAHAVRRGYGDAFITAHFEVPGEMFHLALEAQRERDMGVVGSTSNILSFIATHVQRALDRGVPDRLQFVLGTESGMLTSIVRKVQGMLAGAEDCGVEVEVVFPVAAEAITTAGTAPDALLPGGLAVVPGPASGEGCSAEGGCAACPYMKMNSLAALERVCGMVGNPSGEALLLPYTPNAYSDKIGERSCVDIGCEPILHMRAFQSSGSFPSALTEAIVTPQDPVTL